MESKKEVAAIENGTTIDHIPPKQLFKVAHLLELERIENSTVIIGNNFSSRKMGRKGMIKIDGRHFSESEISRIALVAPDAVLNRIEGYKVRHKYRVRDFLPDRISGLVRCNNPRCITNNEPMDTQFFVIDKEKCQLRCCYCERKIGQDDLIII
ncbi:MAG: aspartate carbamoyltransferase regulatory subunit [Tannerellaceae bacterium]|jgi:aspartate carbamoyltransferase regulatory subunit|nr:aspartate carbamoyltransferase regulatory subunit [Tannerellaceae bacterium]